MKTHKKDELYELFLNNLDSMDPEKHEADMLISKTVEDYLTSLFADGYIPVHFVDGIQDDLHSEVQEMYRKKTYGFIDLKSYLKSQNQKNKRRAS